MHSKQASMPKPPTPRRWLFPPLTTSVQLDEKWSFVGKKEKHREPSNPADADKGDRWDHLALDPERALNLVVVPSRRTKAACLKVVKEVKQKTRERTDLLFTSDEHEPYAEAIEATYGKPVKAKHKGQPRLKMPKDLVYATVKKEREKGRVVKITKTLLIGSYLYLFYWLLRSLVGLGINTSFVERANGTDRHQNARKIRKTYRFSKKVSFHDAMTYFTMYCYNFCWTVRTLPERFHIKGPCTPAMAGELTDHVWSLMEWLTYPTRPRSTSS
jgi:hypothetical protein